MAPPKGRPHATLGWSEEEVATLIKMRGEGCTYKEISAEIGRSASSVHSKARAMGGITTPRILKLRHSNCKDDAPLDDGKEAKFIKQCAKSSDALCLALARAGYKEGLAKPSAVDPKVRQCSPVSHVPTQSSLGD